MSAAKKTSPAIKTVFKKIWPTLRVVLSILLLAKAISHIDWPSLKTALPQLQPAWLILAIIFLLIGNACAGYRWGNLMKAGGFKRKLKKFISLYFAGSLINQGLPTTIGGDSYRAVAAANKANSARDTFSMPEMSINEIESPTTPPRLRKSFFIVGLDRTLGLAGNSLLGAIGLIIGGATLSPWASNLGWLLLIIMVLGASMIAFSLQYPSLVSLFNRIMAKFGMDDVLIVTRKAWGFPRIAFQLPFAILIHLFALAAFWACLKACGINAPIESLTIGMPALGLLLMLPISISGWGLREATLAGVLSLWGLNPSLVVLSSILYGAITLITFLPGLPRLLQRKSSNKS